MDRARFAPGYLLQMSRRGRPGVSTNFMLDLIPSVSQVCLSSYSFFCIRLASIVLVLSAFSLSCDFHRHEQGLAVYLHL
jgi:hypothetical protein